jgi:DNA-binding MarR family transcriptional regulator
MPDRIESLEGLIWEMRRAFRELAAAADRELERLGLQAGDRAFLEFLAREAKPVSLSDLARKYSVSRQHIHQSLRRLPHPEWVEETPDASDGRTVLLGLGRKGRAQWQKIRRLDRAFLGRLAARLPRERVAAAAALLSELRSQLPQGKEPGR